MGHPPLNHMPFEPYAASNQGRTLRHLEGEKEDEEGDELPPTENLKLSSFDELDSAERSAYFNTPATIKTWIEMADPGNRFNVPKFDLSSDKEVLSRVLSLLIDPTYCVTSEGGKKFGEVGAEIDEDLSLNANIDIDMMESHVRVPSVEPVIDGPQTPSLSRTKKYLKFLRRSIFFKEPDDVDMELCFNRGSCWADSILSPLDSPFTKGLTKSFEVPSPESKTDYFHFILSKRNVWTSKERSEYFRCLLAVTVLFLGEES
jgi:hypothetical protein